MRALPGCILPGYVMRDLVSGSQPDPHTQMAVLQTAPGSSVTLGYDRSDPERPRAWVHLDGPGGGADSPARFPRLGGGAMGHSNMAHSIPWLHLRRSGPRRHASGWHARR